MNPSLERCSFAEWNERLRTETDDKSWVGPRPLRQGELLVGRDADIKQVAEVLRTHKLLQLIGLSGVGKTSMLTAGLVPRLREAGYTVAMCRRWDLREQPFHLHVANALYDSLAETGDLRFTDGMDIFDELDELGGTAVIILDQFEEFLRTSGQSLHDAFEFLIDLHQQLRVRLILSYRSEHRHQLLPLDRDPRVTGSRVIDLNAVAKEYGMDLLGRPKRPRDASPGWSPDSVITDEAAKQIQNLWASAKPFSDGSGEPGLLHLQALLSVLDVERGGRAITPAVVEAYRGRAKAARGGRTSKESVETEILFEYALEESATVRLEQAQSAARSAGMNEHAVVGTASILAEIVPHLSSGGYKVSQQIHDLALKVLDEELRQVSADVVEQIDLEAEARDDDSETSGADVAEKLAESVFLTITADLFDGRSDNDGLLLSASRDEILRLAIQDAIPRLAKEGAPGLPPVDWWRRTMMEREDDRYGSAGPMLGLSPLQVLIEQARRFAWALAWLSSLELATVGGGREAMASVRLIHDGFGPALRSWAAAFDELHETAALCSIATRPGLSHEWGDPFDPEDPRNVRYRSDLSGDERNPKFHFNLGFRGNVIIGAQFEHAVFVNCELTGTVFIRCRFSSVTFLNCRLDGALFDKCVIGRGAQNSTSDLPLTPVAYYQSISDAELTRPSLYDLGNPGLGTSVGGAAQLLALYREKGEDDADRVIAQPPGRPASPATGALGVPWRPEGSGLVIHGSRIAAIIFREVRFEGERILFRRVRGSGVEIGELSGFVGIDIQRSLLRHLTLSAATDDKDVPKPCELDLRVEDSVAAQWWVGDGFSGRFWGKGSRLGQVWIESQEVEVILEESCQSTGFVTPKTVSGQRLAARDASETLPLGAADVIRRFGEATSAMDYRHRPEDQAVG